MLNDILLVVLVIVNSYDSRMLIVIVEVIVNSNLIVRIADINCLFIMSCSSGSIVDNCFDSTNCSRYNNSSMVIKIIVE